MAQMVECVGSFIIMNCIIFWSGWEVIRDGQIVNFQVFLWVIAHESAKVQRLIRFIYLLCEFIWRSIIWATTQNAVVTRMVEKPKS